MEESELYRLISEKKSRYTFRFDRSQSFEDIFFGRDCKVLNVLAAVGAIVLIIEPCNSENVSDDFRQWLEKHDEEDNVELINEIREKLKRTLIDINVARYSMSIEATKIFNKEYIVVTISVY